MEFQFSTFIMSLRGPALAVFLAMAWYRRTDKLMTEGFLSSVVGYSEKTVRGALAVLIHHGLVDRMGRFSGYVLTDYSVSLVTTIATAIVDQNKIMTEGAEVERNITDHPVKSTDRDSACYTYLQRQGVAEPMRSRVLQLEWADLEYLKFHFENGLAAGDSIGLILHRIKSHDPIRRSRREINQDPERYRKTWGR